MNLASLRVLHLRKSAQSAEVYPLMPSIGGEVFRVETCQRSLWIGDQELAAQVPAGVELRSGREAYRLLLDIATGLESAVVGETDVLGQLKAAWSGFRAQASRLACELHPWMQAIFEDSRDVRAAFLQNLGASSYGALARRWLAPCSDDRVLIVGAGSIARSVAPHFCAQELWLLNRDSARRDELAAVLRDAGAKRVQLVDNRDAARVANAWRDATHALICVPADAMSDSERASLRRYASGRTLHLGGHRHETRCWQQVPGFGSLSELLELGQKQAASRHSQVEAARRECERRAGMRSLGRSLSIAHGWEDLAAFL